mmetsp:Transcript_9284/g.26130  ORF Transcript_9284/g.26130 Transcript_9284/m.26130 type:complete len:453 (-) Transcript_9284:237-1595(-)
MSRYAHTLPTVSSGRRCDIDAKQETHLGGQDNCFALCRVMQRNCRLGFHRETFHRNLNSKGGRSHILGIDASRHDFDYFRHVGRNIGWIVRKRAPPFFVFVAARTYLATENCSGQRGRNQYHHIRKTNDDRTTLHVLLHRGGELQANVCHLGSQIEQLARNEMILVEEKLGHGLKVGLERWHSPGGTGRYKHIGREPVLPIAGKQPLVNTLFAIHAERQGSAVGIGIENDIDPIHAAFVEKAHLGLALGSLGRIVVILHVHGDFESNGLGGEGVPSVPVQPYRPVLKEREGYFRRGLHHVRRGSMAVAVAIALGLLPSDGSLYLLTSVQQRPQRLAMPFQQRNVRQRHLRNAPPIAGPGRPYGFGDQSLEDALEISAATQQRRRRRRRRIPRPDGAAMDREGEGYAVVDDDAGLEDVGRMELLVGGATSGSCCCGCCCGGYRSSCCGRCCCC